MRIGIDAAILAPRTRHSGIGRYVSQLVEHLPRLAPRDEFVLFAPAGVDPGPVPQTVSRIVIPRPPLGRLSVLAAYQWHLPRVVARTGIDVFHAPTVHPQPTWPSIPWRMPCPLVVTIHDMIPLTFYSSGAFRLPWRQRWFYRSNLRAAARATRIIAVSEASRNELIRQLGIPSDRSITVHNAVEAPTMEVAGRVRMPYLLYVGSFEARKNLVGAIRAFARVAGDLPEHDLVVVAANGSGSRASVDAVIRDAKLAGRVRFEEFVTDERLRALYQHADAFIFPSLAEGFGLPPLEAMACGAPVIASALPAHREVLGPAASYVDPADDAALADAILRVVRDRSLRARMAESGRCQARRYPVDEFVRRTLAVYESAANMVGEPAGTVPGYVLDEISRAGTRAKGG
jgi:glycosyltransferase involved in cell wall biosynthesis